MIFTSKIDYDTVLKINQELVNTVVDTTVVIYKLNQNATKVNSYGESAKKMWFQGVLVPCLIKRASTQATEDVNTTNVEQESEFAFLRYELEQREIYPEAGDIVDFNNSYYEIDNTNEVQLWAGRVEYNHSIVCSTHLTRNTALQLEPPQV